MLMIAVNLAMFFGLSACFYLAATLSDRQSKLRFSDYFGFIIPLREWISRTTLVDLLFYAVGKLSSGIQRGLAIAVSVMVAEGCHRALAAVFGPTHPAPISVGDLIGCYIITFLVGDFSVFGTHYLVHRVPSLWEFHKIHHSATFLSPFTKYRQHPLDEQINNIPQLFTVGFTIAVVQYFYAFSDIQAASMLINLELIGVLLTLDPFRHSHIAISFGFLDGFLQSPDMHRLHHSSDPDHFGRNYGQRLSAWDWIFGTAALPKKGEAFVFGIGQGEDREYDTLLKCYAAPFRKIYDGITNNRAKAVLVTLSEGDIGAKTVRT